MKLPLPVVVSRVDAVPEYYLGCEEGRKEELHNYMYIRYQRLGLNQKSEDALSPIPLASFSPFSFSPLCSKRTPGYRPWVPAEGRENKMAHCSPSWCVATSGPGNFVRPGQTTSLAGITTLVDVQIEQHRNFVLGPSLGPVAERGVMGERPTAVVTGVNRGIGTRCPHLPLCRKAQKELN